MVPLCGGPAGRIIIALQYLLVSTGRETFLDLMNLLLAVATVAFALFILVAGWKGIVEYRKNKTLRNTDLARFLGRLGITLPDGGERMEDKEET